MWWFMLVNIVLIPIVMIIFGRLWIETPPEKINNSYGYRSKRSKQSPEAWEFAHRHFGNLWFRYGVVLLPVSVLAMLPLRGKPADTIGWLSLVIMGVQLIVLLIPIFLTEKALKSKFKK